MNGALRFAVDVSAAGDFRAALAAARAAGFEGATTSAAALRPRELSHTGRREVRALLSRHNLTGAALRADLPGKGLTPDADADRFLALLDEAATLARDCGFALVACDLGRMPRAEPKAAPRPRPIDAGMAGLILLPSAADVEDTVAPAPLADADRRHAAFAVDVLREAGGRADRIGVPLAFSASLAATEDLISLLLATACPLFGRELDPVAVLAEGAEPSAAVAVAPAAFHVRGRDALRGSVGRTRPAAVGEGDAGWPDLLLALRDADFGGFVTVEGNAAESAAALRRLRG